jgi:hypothetical protein
MYRGDHTEQSTIIIIEWTACVTDEFACTTVEFVVGAKKRNETKLVM